MQDHGKTILWTKVVRALTVFMAVSVSLTLAAVKVIELPPSHVMLCPDAYLFELKSEPQGNGAAQSSKAFKSKLARMKSVHIRHEFGTLLNGVSAHVENTDELREIMTWDELRSVTPLTMIFPPEQIQPTQDALVTSALNMTEASRVHAELGLRGKGVKVGVIDTGVDYTHPALGGCFGTGCKVAYGYDLVGNDYNGRNKPIPSANPMDCNGHGTHVSGIIAASNDLVTGVAPEVTLGAYRVLGCEGSTNNDIILAALERAFADEMDVINLSLGEPNGWPNNPISRAIDKVRSHGTMVAAAQGNENDLGLFSTNYVAEGRSVLSVASLINTRMDVSSFTTTLDPSHPVIYSKSKNGPNGTYPVVALLNGTELGFGCDPYKADLTGKIVIVQRGNCLFTVKGQNALDNGAVGILFVNNIPGPVTVDIRPINIVSGTISQVGGQKLFEQLKSNTKTIGSNITDNISVTFNDKPEDIVNESGGSSSLFSSYGLDNGLHVKPDIGAPGENIFSTWLTKNGSYNTISGTSMASPHAAGALALALQYYRSITGSNEPFGKSQIQRIYQTFMNTAVPAYVYNNHIPYDIFAAKQPKDECTAVESVAKQGSGLINIYRALTSLAFGINAKVAIDNIGGEADVTLPPVRSTFVTPSVLELNDTEFASRRPQMITIHNYGSETVRYELSHLPAETLHEISIESREVKMRNQALYNVKSPGNSTFDDVLFVKAQARVIFLSKFVSVPAGGQRRVAIKILPPRRLSLHQHWIYSGYIVIRASSSSHRTSLGGGDTSERIHIPYAGVKGKMKSLPIFLRPTEEELKINNQTALCQVLGSKVENKTELIYSFAGSDLPIVSFCILNPTRFLIMDLLTGGEDDQDSNGLQDNNFKVLGRIASEHDVSRSYFKSIISVAQWDGMLDLDEKSEDLNQRTVGGKEIIHREPGMNLLYGMRPKTSSISEDTVSFSDSHTGSLAQRDIKEDRQLKDIENRHEDLKRKEKKKGGRHEHNKDKSAPSDSKAKLGFRHLLKGNKSKTESAGKIQVPDGRYRIRIRALRMLGDIDNPDDYDSWITPTFTIQRPDIAPNTTTTTTT